MTARKIHPMEQQWAELLWWGPVGGEMHLFVSWAPNRTQAAPVRLEDTALCSHRQPWGPVLMGGLTHEEVRLERRCPDCWREFQLRRPH